MPLIHRGDSTHHHDQATTPTSLSTINASWAIEETFWARFQIRATIDRGCRRQTFNTSVPA